jgi:hypothetical protein
LGITHAHVGHLLFEVHDLLVEGVDVGWRAEPGLTPDDAVTPTTRQRNALRLLAANPAPPSTVGLHSIGLTPSISLRQHANQR